MAPLPIKESKMRHFDLRNGTSLADEIRRKGIDILGEIPFPMTQDRFDFASSCLPLYERYYPEIILEIQSLAKGLKVNEKILFALFFSMYAIIPVAHCSCIAVRNEENVFLGRNSDFFIRMKETNSHFIYNSYHGNSTAFLELEDGRNKAGLAVGFTSVFPHKPKPGLNSGLILRLLLEKADSVKRAIEILDSIPIASSQTYMLADKSGHIAYVECSSEHMEMADCKEGEYCLISTNRFILPGMQPYAVEVDDDWNAASRHESIMESISRSASLNIDAIKESLISASFYDTATGHDTVWSVIEALKTAESWLCEGNPSREDYHSMEL